jgi:hypothetical protein
MLVIILNATVILGQQRFTYEEMISDFDKYIEILENTHPDPHYPFGGRMLFYKQVNSVKENIPKDGLSPKEYHFLLSSFVSQLHDGHTYFDLPDASENSSGSKILPVQFKIVSDGMIVIKTVPELNDLIGARLVKVENKGIEYLLDLAQQFEPCENSIGACFVLNKFLANEEMAKQMFSGMKGSLKFAFKTNDDKVIEHVISFVAESSSLTWKNAKRWDKMVAERPAPFWFRFIDDKNEIGYFPFYTTYSREVLEMLQNMNQDVKPTLEMLYKNFNLGAIPENAEEAFKKIPSINEVFFNMLTEMKGNNSKYLIIDLRQNGGGWTPITTPTLFMLYGDKYFGFNIRGEYNTRVSDLYLKKNNLTIEQYNTKRNSSLRVGDYQFGYVMGNSWPENMSLKERREKYFEQNINFTSGVELMKSQNGSPVYTPKIIVVTSPSTFSAAFHYLFFLKSLGNAVVVGVPTRQAYNSGMEVTTFTLPLTKLSGSISNSYQLLMPEDLIKGRMLIPEFQVSSEIMNRYNYDQDSEIKYVIDLIKSNKIK